MFTSFRICTFAQVLWFGFNSDSNKIVNRNGDEKGGDVNRHIR